MKRNPLLLGILLALAVLVAGYAAVKVTQSWLASQRAKKLRNPVPASAGTLAAGKQLYGLHCQKCHGEMGDGKGEKAGELLVQPTNFTDMSRMPQLRDGEIHVTIMEGKKPMPAFSDRLTDEQGWQLVDYVRSFARPRSPAR